MSGLPFTLRQLEIFERLCNSRSFRETSEQLGISQSAVSNQIKVLEEQIGVRLFTRVSGQRPQLTPEGAAFLADLTPFWNAAKTLAAHRKNEPIRNGQQPIHLKVMISQQMLEDYIRPKLSVFLKENPQIQFQIDGYTGDSGPRQAIAREAYDLGLFTEHASAPLDNNYSEVAPIMCGVFGHRALLKEQQEHLPPEDINRLAFVLPPLGSFATAMILDMLARHNIHPAKVMGRTQYFDVMSAMIETGTCVGASLASLIKPEHRSVVTMLHRLEDWRITLYRKPLPDRKGLALVEKFLVDSVLHDPAYPRYIERE